MLAVLWQSQLHADLELQSVMVKGKKVILYLPVSTMESWAVGQLAWKSLLGEQCQAEKHRAELGSPCALFARRSLSLVQLDGQEAFQEVN